MKNIRKKLLAWYKREKRDLPWRKTVDPYRIWISEVMLQQTRVSTVIPYYERFLDQFPTVETLARTNPEKVLKSWEGLGYYSRARNLHAAAKELVASYGSQLPDKREELQKLPGFGPYTSAAVASIAFKEPVATVDGNVRRVVSRIFAAHEDIDDLAQSLLDPDDPADFNQAMMELGALICLPKVPNCPICPIESECQARQKNLVPKFPAALPKTKVKNIYATTFVIQNGTKVFITQRPAQGRYAGFWEFPTIETKKPIQQDNLGNQLISHFGLTISELRKLGNFRHQLTHRTIHVNALSAKLDSISKQREGKWVDTSEWTRHPFSKLQQRVAALAVEILV